MNNYSKIGVHIKVNNFYNSLKFYLKLGFKKVFAYGDEEYIKNYASNIPHAHEKYRGMSFEIGNAVLEIADGHIAVKPEVFKEKVNSSKISLFIDTDSLSSVLQSCKENSITIVKEPTEYHWGTREMVVRDPDGVILVFREPLNK